MYIYTHSAYSEGATLLKGAMGLTKIRHEKSKFKGSQNKIVINWGSSSLPSEVLKCNVINNPDAIALASNKLSFFKKVDSKLCVPWTDNLKDAIKWCGDGYVVMARTKLTGHSGEGIIVMSPDKPEGFVKAPLYTQYIGKKGGEFRVHVVSDEVIDVQRKTLRREKAESGEEINWHIRNLDNGFIYQRQNVETPKCVTEAAIAVVEQVGLDFGAVDVIYNEKQKKAFVLEINTAPGITGTTVGNYARALGGFK